MAKTNLAYDFEKLEQHYAAPGTPKVKQPPELRVVENRNAGFNATMFRGAAIFVLVLGIVCAILYNNMILTELTSKIENTESQFEMLKNENRLMQVQLEGKTSLRTVQEIAENQLGMAKVESYQVQYIDLGEGDRVVLARAPKLGLTDHIHMAYRSVLEYLGF
ncbi:MAG: hypothetical protein K0S22_1958 [Oscillospiraceae bacterium]|jgi:cell division protein FtsL|nr:hypothetical protein [Oscillospiraceae bacterium]